MVHLWEGMENKMKITLIYKSSSEVCCGQESRKINEGNEETKRQCCIYLILSIVSIELKEIYPNAFRGKTPYLSANNPLLHNPPFQTEARQHERKMENE